MEKRDLTRIDQILEEALAREKEARDFYRRLAAQSRVDFVKELLERLGDEEAKHVGLVQGLITRLNLGESIV